jgi:hypothetical protein
MILISSLLAAEGREDAQDGGWVAPLQRPPTMATLVPVHSEKELLGILDSIGFGDNLFYATEIVD